MKKTLLTVCSAAALLLGTIGAPANAYDPPIPTQGVISVGSPLPVGKPATVRITIKTQNGTGISGPAGAVAGRIRVVVKCGPEGRLTQRYQVIKSVRFGRAVAIKTAALTRRGHYRIVVLFVPSNKAAYLKSTTRKTVIVR